ncbi:MAG: ABC transporter permease, partial [Parvimonas micra]|nr:ABC transporter permease [Parvimonas micra]
MFRLIKFVDKKLIYKRAFIKLAVKSMFIISPFLSQKFIDSIIGKDKSNMILFAILNVVAYILSQIIFYFDDISLGVCETNSYKNILNTVYK